MQSTSHLDDVTLASMPKKTKNIHTPIQVTRNKHINHNTNNRHGNNNLTTYKNVKKKLEFIIMPHIQAGNVSTRG